MVIETGIFYQHFIIESVNTQAQASKHKYLHSHMIR